MRSASAAGAWMASAMSLKLRAWATRPPCSVLASSSADPVMAARGPAPDPSMDWPSSLAGGRQGAGSAAGTWRLSGAGLATASSCPARTRGGQAAGSISRLSRIWLSRLDVPGQILHGTPSVCGSGSSGDGRPAGATMTRARSTNKEQSEPADRKGRRNRRKQAGEGERAKAQEPEREPDRAGQAERQEGRKQATGSPERREGRRRAGRLSSAKLRFRPRSRVEGVRPQGWRERRGGERQGQR